jgi:hypothetical protein
LLVHKMHNYAKELRMCNAFKMQHRNKKNYTIDQEET